VSDPLLVAGFAVLGTVYGFGADLIAHGWPEHEADYERRRVDWRTAVLTITGGLAFGGLASRWGTEPLAMAVYGLAFAALIVLLATDLDQKLLPDLITLPLIGFAAAVLVLGWSPALAGKELGLASGIAAGIGAPALLVLSDRLLGGDLGLGDVKLSVSLGLLFGISHLFQGLLVASVGFAVVLLGLLAVRRIGLKSAVPFGPVLIFAAFVAALLG
jgi:leader peptidase (prepilin peptidase) / N-methyltransferase